MSTPNQTRWLDDDLALIDLQFQGVDRVIASYLLRTADGYAMIETGPSSTLAAMDAGLKQLGVAWDEIKHVFITHIHLDHAGAAGSVLERAQEAVLYVHEIGVRHVVDPSALVSSATRIFGDKMETLWGAIVPVPAERIVTVTDDDLIDIPGRPIRVLYTPGHAIHHVALYDLEHGNVFTGDVGGIRIPPAPDVLPPTPPPDIDVPAWYASIERIESVNPRQLLLTHFGPYQDVEQHLATLRTTLDEWAALIEKMRADGVERDAQIVALRDHFGFRTDEMKALVDQVELASPYDMSVDGMLRYLRKRDERAAAG